MELKEIIDHHGALRKDWQQQLQQLETGQIVTRKATGEDATPEIIHFMRGQIARLDALDRLLSRMWARRQQTG